VQSDTANNVHGMRNPRYNPAFTTGATAHGLFADFGVDEEGANRRIKAVASG
jgi:hypothetical protein